jgi:hypothetical protein
MSESTELFDLVQSLAAERPFAVESVSKRLGEKVELVPGRSTAPFSIYRTRNDAGRLFTEIELRVPKATASSKDGLLILSVQPGLCIGKKEVMLRFGEVSRLSIPTPRQPPEDPLFFVYKLPWGDLSFGFDRLGSECLVSVVLNATRG